MPPAPGYRPGDEEAVLQGVEPSLVDRVRALGTRLAGSAGAGPPSWRQGYEDWYFANLGPAARRQLEEAGGEAPTLSPLTFIDALQVVRPRNLDLEYAAEDLNRLVRPGVRPNAQGAYEGQPFDWLKRAMKARKRLRRGQVETTAEIFEK
jgi:hypothetical protein